MGDISGHDKLARPFENLKISSEKKQQIDELGSNSGSNCHTCNIPSADNEQHGLSSSSSDMNESTCSTFLSGSMNGASSGTTTEEEFNDKTHFITEPQLEILQQPQDCTVARSSCIKLTCKARIINSKSTEDEPEYLWYKDGEPLVGEISDQCILEEVEDGDGGRYFCLISHPNGLSNIQSQTATVTVKTVNGRFTHMYICTNSTYTYICFKL